MIRLEDVLPRLKEFFSNRRDVELAILFGSLVERGYSVNDADVAIKLSKVDGKLLTLGGIVHEIAKVLGLSEDKVDVVDIDDADVYLLWRIVKGGIVLKGDEFLRELKRIEEYPDAAMELSRWEVWDPEPRVDKSIIASRTEEVRRNVAFLKQISGEKVEELTYRDVLALERGLHRTIEAMMDVCRHLVAVYSLGLAEKYGEYAEKLVSAGKMPKDLGDELVKLIGLRNILVHRYLEVKVDLLIEAARRLSEGIAANFLRWISGIDP